MRNSEIFNDFDMVVAISQKTINDQLSHLVRLGVIHPRLRISQDMDADGNYVYTILDDNDSPVPEGRAFIDATILPAINVKESGEIVTFVLNFLSGTAGFWHGSGPQAVLQTHDMKGWLYALTVSLDLTALEAHDLGHGKVVPDIVKQQVNNFNSQMFDVNHLFMDFESTDLLRFDPEQSKTASGGDEAMQQMVLFMQFYLSNLKKNGNPYILGYSITTNDKTQYDKDQIVPENVRPVSTTFSMFHDPKMDDRSTLNFVLATKGGHGVVKGTPGVFDDNWLGDDQCDAKMIFSHSVLIEPMLLKPFFDQFSQQVWNGIKDDISVAQGNSYADAKKSTEKGYGYTISDIHDGRDQYVNKFTVEVGNADGLVSLNFSGALSFYKEIDKDLNIKASTDASMTWSATYNLVLDKSGTSDAEIKITHSSKIDSPITHSYMSEEAKAFAWIGKILGSILDFLTAMQDKGFFGNLFAGLMSVSPPGIGDVSAAFGELGNLAQTAVMLPAGQVFFFKSPASDSKANLAMQLTYKSES